MTTESITWRIPNMDCAAEESEIRHALRDVAGVQRLAFRLGARELRVDAAPGALPEVAQRLRAAGFAPQVPGAPKAAAAEGPACDSAACGPMQLSTHDHQHDDHGHGHEHDHHHDHDHDHADEAATGWRTLLLAPGLPRIGAALVLALAAEAVHALAPGGWAAVGMGLAVAAVLLSGLSTYLKGVNALRRGRLNISALMAVAVTGALLIGQWPEAAMVMALYALAEHLEARAVDRARGAIGGLLQMAPDTVEQRAADDTWQAVAAAEVPVGAVMRVKPGARLALDGVVTAGQSAIDQSPVTGESLPVDKALGDAVYAGTLNQSGVLEVRVTAAAQDTQLARIIHAVEQAQSERAPTQAFIDRFAAVYTPAVFVLALGVALLGPWLAGWTWLTAIYKALVLLVIACPCALVISTPVTVVSGLAFAARRGILVKGGTYLEQARLLKAVALDKTGTLTEGKPQLVAWQAWDGADEATVRRLAASMAGRSDHPVSKAIAAGLTSDVASVDGFTALVGRGTEGVVDGQRLVLGKHQLIEERQQCSPALEATMTEHEALGRTVSLLANDQGVLGWFAVADTVKPSSQQAVAHLKSLGVTPVMLTGDNTATASAVAAEVGITDVRGNLLPEDKLRAIQDMQQRYGVTGMSGDGINDAPALAQADIGFAMGGAGTDIAVEAADVVIMNDDLGRIAETIEISRRTHSVLWQNISLALGIKAVFLVLAVFGNASMWMAVFADMGASLLVVANGLRLLRTRSGS